ncbi:MAG TPA: sigma-70 family RNA polymerase sigma factor [Candidatus Lachnoclostridium stercoravium]|uniref:Sigma-70 family RNA polymerase sigma factor n=1 Tax=Candidatus Lachnoclostridium stercoravium TaxID=2838633 RepID=A0A9D2KLH4_9FIRM|nr:sigma-70 family RNA polymerase sigma factor [Candidatus Lachnoclostridium stercoravium]
MQKRRCERIANEILMLLRSSKKYSREVSLFEPIGVDKDGETVSLVDVLEMDNKEVLDSIILTQDVKELYEAYETCLKDNEKQVIRMRYGLFGQKEETQREIAEKLGISRSYVSRIEKKAIEKIKAEFERSSRRT